MTSFERFIATLLLLGEVVLGQGLTSMSSAESPPIAYLSRKTTGTWFDEKIPGKPRKLAVGDEIFADSRLIRHNPKSESDTAWLNLPDGSYESFACRRPLMCEPAIDLSPVKKKADPYMRPFQRVVEVVSGKTRGLRPKFHDTAFVLSNGLSLNAVMKGTIATGSYSFAWCMNALTRKCPDVPDPITVNWNPDNPRALIPTSSLTPGLHRLVLLKKTEGEWFYTGEDAWVLAASDGEIDVTRLEAALKTIHEETNGLSDQTSARVRAVIILAAAAEGVQ